STLLFPYPTLFRPLPRTWSPIWPPPAPTCGSGSPSGCCARPRAPTPSTPSWWPPARPPTRHRSPTRRAEPHCPASLPAGPAPQPGLHARRDQVEAGAERVRLPRDHHHPRRVGRVGDAEGVPLPVDHDDLDPAGGEQFLAPGL